nr:6749_t:CDS:2 [Entrophospora candida]
MPNYQAKRDSGFFETTSSVINSSVTNSSVNQTPFSSYFGLYEIKLTKKHFDKLSSSHYWTYEPLENILPSKKITNTSNNTTKSNIRNNSNSNIKPSKNNNKSTITTPKIEKETIIPFSNYLGLTGQPPTEKFDVADHYWTNLPLEAILPSKSKYKNTKNKKNSSFTPSSINLNLFTKYERLMNKNKR